MRANVDELIVRLGRLHASAVTLRETSDSMRPGDAGGTITEVLDSLERDLRLVARDIARVRGSIA